MSAARYDLNNVVYITPLPGELKLFVYPDSDIIVVSL